MDHGARKEVAGSLQPRLAPPLLLSPSLLQAPSLPGANACPLHSPIAGTQAFLQHAPILGFVSSVPSAPGNLPSESGMNGARLMVKRSNGSERGPPCFVPDVPTSL